MSQLLIIIKIDNKFILEKMVDWSINGFGNAQINMQEAGAKIRSNNSEGAKLFGGVTQQKHRQRWGCLQLC